LSSDIHYRFFECKNPSNKHTTLNKAKTIASLNKCASFLPRTPPSVKAVTQVSTNATNERTANSLPRLMNNFVDFMTPVYPMNYHPSTIS